MRYLRFPIWILALHLAANGGLHAQVLVLDATGLRTVGQLAGASGLASGSFKINLSSQAPSMEYTWVTAKVTPDGANSAWGFDAQLSGQTSWSQTFQQAPNSSFSILYNRTIDYATGEGRGTEGRTLFFTNLIAGPTGQYLRWRENSGQPVQSKYQVNPDALL